MKIRQPAKIHLLFDFVRNMGLRYVAFRFLFELFRRTGILRRRFPTDVVQQQWVDLATWRLATPAHFIRPRAERDIPIFPSAALSDEVAKMQQGQYLFFSSRYYAVGTGYDWVTHPITGYRYDTHQHWTTIPDLDPVKGDIKYVWELSRFSHLLKIIRHDYHTGTDHGAWVFEQIDHWIAHNPINRGPNWRCSQEISLRTLNWISALHYYRHHAALTPERFDRILHVIYWQLHHIYANIHFSRIAVRNNHAITETLTLYLAGLLLPYFPESAQWKKKGKKWFETEIAYQIYPDGSYLQHAMNYHRVVIQLLTWGLSLAALHDEEFHPIVVARAVRTVAFLEACIEPTSGHTPNYGSNDGALFFPFSSSEYRDYRPQVNALRRLLSSEGGWHTPACAEEAAWYGLPPLAETDAGYMRVASQGLRFDHGGYYTWRDTDTFTFLRCATYKDRPAQADNLHLDIWANGNNILRDAGTYRYNVAEAGLLDHFWGTKGHNTVGIAHADQMYKGGRFIWFFWNKAQVVLIEETDTHWTFEGEITAFKHIAPGIIHRRRVTKYKQTNQWDVWDTVNRSTGLPMQQYWHPNPAMADRLSIVAQTADGHPLELKQTTGWHASVYGEKEEAPLWYFETHDQSIKTKICLD